MKKQPLSEIVRQKFNISNKEAEAIILSGKVLVNDVVKTKCREKTDPTHLIRIKDNKKYVSRGALKLEPIIEELEININNKICIDIGSSTGGFTEILLKYGSKKVYAIDSGENQLAYKLRINPKIILYENTRIQDIALNFFNDLPEIAVSDLSFTSTYLAIKSIINIIKPEIWLILIKPQFEYVRLQNILNLNNNFNGIVGSDEIREKIVLHIKDEFGKIGLLPNKILKCPVKGTKGNQEYFFYIKSNK